MSTPNIRGLGVVQDGSPNRWKATGYVDGLGWLEAWGTSLVDALKALQTRAAKMARRGQRRRTHEPQKRSVLAVSGHRADEGVTHVAL